MNKKAKTLLSIGAGILLCSSMMTMSSCSSTNTLVFGNFYSYISEDVKDIISNNMSVNWQYYGSNQEIPTYLKNKTLNLAVATNDMVAKLALDNQISKIDYSLFELINPLDKTIVKDVTGLKGIITDSAYTVATKAFEHYKINLLDYGIPYFLQNFCFAYTGPEIKELSKPNVTYKDIFNVISTDSRFKKVTMIDDARTMFDLSKIIYSYNNKKPININPTNGLINTKSNTPIWEFEEIYNSLISELKKSNHTSWELNSDSNYISNKIAKNECQGAFFYNGDAIFAAQGADYSSLGVNPTVENFHIVTPSDTLIAMDSIIFNKSNSTYQQNLALKLAYQITLAGSNTNSFNKYNSIMNYDNKLLDPQKQDIFLTDQNDSYVYLPMQNFDYVNYTPILKSIYDFAANGAYFNEYGNIASTLKQSINIKVDPNTVSNFVEMPLNNQTESNMKIAYITFKNSCPN